MSRDEVLHIGIAKRSRDSQDSIHAIVQYQTAGIGNTPSLVLVATLMIVRQAQSLSRAAQDDACVSDIGRVQDPLTGRSRL